MTSRLSAFRLDNQVALVTGASRGIGAETAKTLAEAGAALVVVSRSAASLGEVVAAIEAAGGRALAVEVDVNDLEAVAALPRIAFDAFGRLDVVVNNAGGTMPRPFLATTPGYLERAFHFNVTTAFALTQAAVPYLLTEGGSVVNISSAIGRLRDRGMIAYGTAKAAMAHMTRLAAADLAPRIRVNAIAVGSTATSALDVVLQSPEILHEMQRRTPLRRLGDPSDIALGALYLASPAAAWITGKVLEIDGGLEEPNLDLGFPDLGPAELA